VLTELRPRATRPYRWPPKLLSAAAAAQSSGCQARPAWRCVAKNSFAVLRRKLRHFASRGALNIEGLGPSTIDALLEERMIENFDDFFTLTEGDVLTLEGFADVSAKN